VNRRLFVGPVAGDFDPELDIAAGPWCFAGREANHPGWESLEFVEPFDTPEKLVAAEIETAALTDDRVARWADRLNLLHGLDRPEVFWGRYLNLWISLVAMATWARWRNAEELVARYGDVSMDVPVCSDAQFPKSLGFPDFMSRLISDPVFQLALDSGILRRLCPDAWTLVEQDVVPAHDMPTDETAPVQASLVRRLLPRMAVDHLPGLVLSKPLYSALVALLPRRAAAENRVVASLEDGAFPADYLAFLDWFLAETVPDSIGGAGFRSLDSAATALRYVPGRLYVANTRSPSDQARMIAAHALIAGERLVNAQHGGWEGTTAAVPWNRQTYADDHAFLTWGWERQAGLPGRCLPHIAPALSNVRNRHRATTSTLVMVGARLAANGMRFDCVPRPRAMLKYRQGKVAFLNALREDVRAQAQYRPYTRDACDFEEKTYLQRHVPAVSMIDTDFHRSMLNSRLLVIDHPGTTMHIAVAANVPMVCFWNPADWPLCAEAKPYFDSLEKAGILYADADSAAAHVNAIWADVPAWWRSADVVNAIAAWRNQFARTRRFSRLALIGTLWRLSRQEGDQDREATPIPNGRWYESQTNSRVVH